MLRMTTLGRIYRTVTGMADYGRRLPATEQLAWRALAVQLQEFADQDQEFADQAPSWPTWSPPPEGVAEGVRALHGQLVTMNTPVSALVARWVSLWLAECADQTQRRAQRAQARATAQQDPARPEPLVTRRCRWGTSASRRAVPPTGSACSAAAAGRSFSSAVRQWRRRSSSSDWLRSGGWPP
jgi:hypothetical protein